MIIAALDDLESTNRVFEVCNAVAIGKVVEDRARADYIDVNALNPRTNGLPASTMVASRSN